MKNNKKIISEEAHIPCGNVKLTGNLDVPQPYSGIVIFAHGSGSSRFSPRNQFVAKSLQNKGIATLLFDLLTPKEDENYGNRFNISLLSDRLYEVAQWLIQKKEFQNQLIGFFGASTGAAAALMAAARLEKKVAAIVSRGGRPDLAKEVLHQIRCPTLFIVGEEDEEVLELNQLALQEIRGPKELHVVPEATHLFEEPGALEEVTQEATEWFQKYLQAQVKYKEKEEELVE